MLAFALAAATADEERHLPIPPLAFGLITFAIFLVLFGVLFAFKSVGTKH